MRKEILPAIAAGLGALVLGACFLSSRAWAAPPEAGAPLRLADLLVEVRGHNPAMRVARERSKAMAAMPVQVSAWDDPTLSYEGWNIPPPLRIARADNSIFKLSQKIPFPGKRRLAGEIAAYEAEQAAHQVGLVELELDAAVKYAYYNLWQAHQRLAVLEREKELLTRFARIAEQKYVVGKASQADVLRAQVELTHVLTQLQTEPLAIDSARAELNALLSRAPDEPLGVPETPPPPQLDISATSLAELALEKRPELAAQGAAISREQRAVELADRNHLPDFEFSVGRFVNYDQSDGFGLMASVTLPFVNAAKYEAGVAEARAKLAVARAERRRLEDALRREVQQTFLEARAAFLRYDLFVNTHIPQAEQALRVAESGYATNELGFLELIDSLRRLESVHLDHITAQADFERARAELERLAGTDLARPRPGDLTEEGPPHG